MQKIKPKQMSIEEMMNFLEEGALEWLIGKLEEYPAYYTYAFYNYSEKNSDENYVSAFEKDKKIALIKCCEERIKRGL